jgi:hypothetical protein
MAPIVTSIEIARRPEDVFAYVIDPARLPEWQESLLSTRTEGGGPPTVGARLTQTRRVGRTERTMTLELTELAPRGAGRLAASTGRSGRSSRVRSSPSTASARG